MIKKDLVKFYGRLVIFGKSMLCKICGTEETDNPDWDMGGLQI